MPKEITIEHKIIPGTRVLHIVVGSPDWDPSDQEMKDLADIFNGVLRDPQGGVVVTRPEVRVTDLTPSAAS